MCKLKTLIVNILIFSIFFSMMNGNSTRKSYKDMYKHFKNIMLKQNLIYKIYVVMISLFLATTRIVLIGATRKALLVG